jgi:hypothetical protein
MVDRNTVFSATDEEAISMTAIDEALDKVDRKFNSGEFCPFGRGDAGIMQKIESIRKAQMDIFLQHMSLEMRFAKNGLFFVCFSKRM